MQLASWWLQGLAGRGAGVPQRSQTRACGCRGAPAEVCDALQWPQSAADVVVRCHTGVEVRKERCSPAVPIWDPGQAAEFCGMSRCLQLLQDGAVSVPALNLGRFSSGAVNPTWKVYGAKASLAEHLLGRPVCTPPALLATPVGDDFFPGHGASRCFSFKQSGTRCGFKRLT